MAPNLSGRERTLILTTTILASGLGFLMNSAVNIALPTIQASLDVDIATIQWVASAFSLALASLILLSGSLGDVYGVRRVYNLGIGIFTLGTLACGISPGPGWLIGSRAVQGLGAALMIPGSLAIINRTFAPSERGRVIGLWAGVSGAIAAFGPFVGGVLTDISWRLVFLAIAPLGVLAFFFSRFAVPELPGDRRRRLDLAGLVPVVAGLAGLVLALVRLPDTGFTAVTWIGLGVAAVAIPVFVVIERRQDSPLVPFSMFTPLVAGANVATLLIYFGFQAAFFLLSFNLQQLQGFSSTVAGLGLLPATALIAILSSPSGSITDSRGPRLQMIAGPSLMAGALLLLMILPGRESRYLVSFLPGVLLMGLGIVAIIPAITKSALSVPEELSGTASGVNNSAARLAGLLAVTIMGTIVNAAYRAALASGLADAVPQRLRDEVLAGAGQLLGAPLPDAAGEFASAIRVAMESSFVLAYRLAIGVALLAVVGAIVVSFVSIRGEEATPEESE